MLSIAQLLVIIDRVSAVSTERDANSHLIVITSTKIYHDMLVSACPKTSLAFVSQENGEKDVPIEEHHRARVVQLVHLRNHSHAPSARSPRPHNTTTHLVEVRHLGDVAEVDDGKVLNALGNGIQRFVHRHTLTIPVMAKADNHDAILFGFDGLIDVPSRR